MDARALAAKPGKSEEQALRAKQQRREQMRQEFARKANSLQVAWAEILCAACVDGPGWDVQASVVHIYATGLLQHVLPSFL